MVTITNLAAFGARLSVADANATALVPMWLNACANIVEENLTVGGRYSPGTPVDSGEALAGWKRRAVANGVVFENDVPHVPALEGGHSAQAPEGMRAPIVLQWDVIQRDALHQLMLPRLAAAVK